MRQDDVAFGDAADAGLQNLRADFIGAQLGERALDGFGRTLHVGLEHQRQQSLLAGFAGLEQLVQRLARDAGLTALRGACGRDIPPLRGRGLRILTTTISSPASGAAGQAQHFDGHRGTGGRHRLAAIVLQQAHAAPFRAGHDDVADMQRAALDQHGGDRAAALVELGLDHRAFGGAVGIGLEVENFGLQQDGFFQLVEIGALGGGDFDRLRFAAQFFDLDFMLQQFGLHPQWDWRRPCRSC